MRYTKRHLIRLEKTLTAAGYVLRYERGGFASSACRLHGQRMLVMNQFLSLEDKIERLLGVLKSQGVALPPPFLHESGQEQAPHSQDKAVQGQ